MDVGTTQPTVGTIRLIDHAIPANTGAKDVFTLHLVISKWSNSARSILKTKIFISLVEPGNLALLRIQNEDADPATRDLAPSESAP